MPRMAAMAYPFGLAGTPVPTPVAHSHLRTVASSISRWPRISFGMKAIICMPSAILDCIRAAPWATFAWFSAALAVMWPMAAPGTVDAMIVAADD